MDSELECLCAIVRKAAQEELLPRFADVSVAFKPDGSIVTAADTAMQARLTAELNRGWPGYRLLGEEMPEPEQKHLLDEVGRTGLWCLDPLDGTSNFFAGLPFFAVSLALLSGDGVELALVYDPMREECFTARRGVGAWLNGTPLGRRRQATTLKAGMGIVDFKRLQPALAACIASGPPFASQRNFGASALEWCLVAAGRCHVYLHGRQKLWDYAAGSLILAEAGGHAATLEGEPVFRGRLESRSVVASLDEGLFRAWQAWLEQATGS